MIPFELAEPRSLKEAISLLDGADETVRPIAGGTALMLMMKAGVFRPARLVSLRALGELSAISTQRDGALRIGAMTPLAAVERSAQVRRVSRPTATKRINTGQRHSCAFRCGGLTIRSQYAFTLLRGSPLAVVASNVAALRLHAQPTRTTENSGAARLQLRCSSWSVRPLPISSAR